MESGTFEIFSFIGDKGKTEWWWDAKTESAEMESKGYLDSDAEARENVTTWAKAHNFELTEKKP